MITLSFIIIVLTGQIYKKSHNTVQLQTTSFWKMKTFNSRNLSSPLVHWRSKI